MELGPVVTTTITTVVNGGSCLWGLSDHGRDLEGVSGFSRGFNTWVVSQGYRKRWRQEDVSKDPSGPGIFAVGWTFAS